MLRLSRSVFFFASLLGAVAQPEADANSCSAEDLACHASGSYEESGLLQTLRRQSGHQATRVATESCHMSNSSTGCRYASLSKDKVTFVYPEGEKVGCMYGDPFNFAVYPAQGESKRLLFFFAGGGACWLWPGSDKPVLACFTEIGPDPQAKGIFDRVKAADDGNIFRDYTIVYVNYCTGDLHLGTEKNEWVINGTKTAIQNYGYHNAKAAMTWTQDNFGSDVLDSFVVGGLSAGSLGVYAWAQHLLGTFKAEHKAVFADSYAGYFPVGVEQPLLRSWGACSAVEALGFPKAAQYCNWDQGPEEMILLMYRKTIRENPQILFGNIQSKGDATQRMFYGATAASQGNPKSLTEAELYNGTNGIFAANEKVSGGNYAAFYVDGTKHILTQGDTFYTTTTKGIHGSEQGEQLLSHWLATFAKPFVKDSPAFACSGPVVRKDIPNSTDYCLKSLA